MTIRYKFLSLDYSFVKIGATMASAHRMEE